MKRVDYRLRIGMLAALVAALVLTMTAPAGATTFCVPSFSPACPAGGGNVAQASLQAAMQAQGIDGVADVIVLAPGTITDTDPYTLSPADTDPLEIVGAGPAATAVTTTSSSNEFVMNLIGNRVVTVRDLTIRIPASFPNGAGSALQAAGDTFVNVDIESRNVGSNGSSMGGGSTFADGRVYGSMGGSISTAISVNGTQPGTFELRRTTIEDAFAGIRSDAPEVPVFARRVHIVGPTVGLRVRKGAFAAFENGVIETSGTARPVLTESVDAGTVIANVRHTTIIGSNLTPGYAAISAHVGTDPGTGPINLVVADTLIAGYEQPLFCQAPSAPNVGNASLKVSYSYLFQNANLSGDCNVSTTNTLDAADPQIGPPQFAAAGDYHLPPGSPAIDAGDPLTATLATEDFDGLPRPVDGNADGSARRDIGAFEHQPPQPPSGSDPPLAADPAAADVPQSALPAPGFAADTFVTLRLAARRVRRNRLLRVRIANGNVFPVSGRLSVRTLARRPAGSLRLGTSGFEVGPRGSATVVLRLPRRLRALLLERRRLRLRLFAELRGPTGETRAVGARVTALAARRLIR